MLRNLTKLKYLVLLAVTGSVISLDQLTKHLIIQRFRFSETLPIVMGIFNLTYVRNPGAAFGLLSRLDPSVRVPFFIIVPMVALGVIFYVFRKVDDTDISLAAALSLVIGGAFGNLVDRAAYNYVIDFLDFHWDDAHFPSFNVADIAITVGVAFIIFDIIRKELKLRAKLG